MRRWGAVVFWVGVVMLVLGVAGAVWGGTRAVGSVTSAVDSASEMPGGTGLIELDEAEQATVYQRTDSVNPTAVCQAQGPDGDTLGLSRATETRGSLGEASYVNVGSFEAPVAGTYTVTCTGGETVLGPSLDFEALGGGTVALVLGLVLAGFGGTVLIIGAVLWFVGRSRAASTGQGGGGSFGAPGNAPPPPPPPSH